MKRLRHLLWLVLGWCGCGGALAQDSVRPFHTVLVADSLMVAVRRLPDMGVQPGALHGVVAEVRLAERQGGVMRLATEWLATFDCQASPWRVAVWRKLRNVADATQPVLWMEQLSHLGVSGAAGTTGPGFEVVEPVWESEPLRVQLPTHWQAAAAFSCRAGRQGDEAWAQLTNQHMGLPDLQNYRCPLSDRQGREAGTLALAYSPATGAVRVNDKWVAAGVMDPKYVGFALDGVDFRFMRGTAALRMVHRDEMQSLASARCVLVSKGGQPVVSTGW